jgi:hypothetical protein
MDKVSRAMPAGVSQDQILGQCGLSHANHFSKRYVDRYVEIPMN